MSRDADAYQGEIEGTDTVREAFLMAMRSGSDNLSGIYPEMKLVWKQILKAARKIAETSQREVRPGPYE